VKKIFVAALLLTLLLSDSVQAASDSVTVYLAFVFYSEKSVSRSIVVGGATFSECQEVFKAFLSGVDGANTQDFSVSSCKAYSLSDLPRS
jgi:hypothetical protein